MGPGANLFGFNTATDSIHYPTHMQTWHEKILDDEGDTPPFMSVMEAVNRASSLVGGSPYDGLEAYDPTDDLDLVEEAYDEYSTAVDAISPDVDLAAAMEYALTQVDDDESLKIDAYLDAMEARQKQDFARSIGRVATGLWDIRGHMSTQFDAAIVALEDSRRNSFDAEDAKLRLQNHRDKWDQVLRLADAWLKDQNLKLQAQRDRAGFRADLARVRIVAYQDKLSNDIEAMVKDSLWDLELFGYAHQALASITGAVTMPRNQTGKERLLGAITTSLATGFQVGPALGMLGPEAAIGGGVASALLSFAGQMWAAQ